MTIHGSAPAEVSNTLVNTITAQTEAITLLTAAITRLSVLPSGPSPPEPIPRPQHAVPYWYRVSDLKSRSKENKDGDIIAGNPDWRIDSEDDIALYFAEFHSDKTSKKDTPLISATHDPIRAIKAAYQAWNLGPFETRDPAQVYISVIQSTECYSAKDLKDKALAMPLCSRLSREARDRLKDPKSVHLYDSEGIFVARIAKEHIKVRVSLQDLFDRNLRNELLPELCEKDAYYRTYLTPSAIRHCISSGCDLKKAAQRFKNIYCALAGTVLDGSKRSALVFAQHLMQGDPALEPYLKEVGFKLIQAEIRRSRVRRREPCRFVEDSD